MEPDETQAAEASADSSLLGRFEAAVRGGGRDPYSALAELLSSGAGPDPGVVQLQGTELDGCRLDRLVGVGGMGATYRATAAGGGPVAVKVVGGLSAERLDRFESECAFLQQLRHPGIVRYRGHGFLDGGRGWLVMDFVDGRNLEGVLDDLDRGRTGPVLDDLLAGLPADRAQRLASDTWRHRVLAIAAKVAEALAHAHEAGIVHRDLKPGNILLRADLDPVVIDFGLSRDLFRRVPLTHSHVLIGTLACMAPEQLSGDPHAADPRTDVFALGLVLFRLLTGRDLRSDVGEVVRFARRPLVLEDRGAGVLPAAYRGILYGCLEPDPGRRYPSMRALLADLEAVEGGRPPARRPPGAARRFLRTKSGRWSAGVILAMAALVAVVALWPEEPYLLTIDCLADAGVEIDGAPPPRSTPYVREPTRPGGHDLRFLGNERISPLDQRIFIDRHHTRVVLLTVSTAEKTGLVIGQSLDDGGDWALLRVVSGDPFARVFLEDGREIRPGAPWLQVQAGKHVIRAMSPDLRTETQDVELRPKQINEFHVFAAEMKDTPGRFRRTLGSVFSPLPQEIQIDLEDGASRFLNGGEDDDLQSPVHVCHRSCVTTEGDDEVRQAVLRVTFPKSMRSVAFRQMSSLLSPAVMELAYRLDDGRWIGIKVDDRLVVPEVPPGGARTLELRARMSCDIPPAGHAYAEFLWGYFDVPPGESRSSCFAVVADPDPPR